MADAAPNKRKRAGRAALAAAALVLLALAAWWLAYGRWEPADPYTPPERSQTDEDCRFILSTFADELVRNDEQAESLERAREICRNLNG